MNVHQTSFDAGAIPAFDRDAVHAHVDMLHRLAKLSGVDGVLILACYGENPQTGRKTSSRVQKFSIGDVENMVDAIMQMECEEHLNVYAPWAIFRRGLGRGERGGTKDILCTLALVADLDADTGKIGELPLPAPYVVESSAGNSQPVYPLSRVLPLDESHALAGALADWIGCDHGTGDIVHVWRVAGTLNWPNKRKLERGRSPVPQQVRITGVWSGELVDPDVLRAAVGSNKTKSKPGGDRDAIMARIAANAFLGAETIDWINRRHLDKDQGDRSAHACRVIGRLFYLKLTDAEIMLVASGAAFAERYTLNGGDKDLAKDIERLRSKRQGQTSEEDETLERMNARYAVVQIGGKMRIAYFEPSPVFSGVDTIVYSDRANFVALRHRERVSVRDEKGNIKLIGIGSWWLGHEGRRQYERVAYDPSCSDPTTFNLWRGFSCKPIKGDCGLYVQHLRDNICGGNEQHLSYLLDWMARAVQQPGVQGEVAVVLRGKEGVGKGVAIGQFGKLFGAHFLQVSQPRHLVGNFNGPLQSVSLLFADEAFFAGDRSHEGVLKALVTEPTLQIEIKGVEPITAQNSLHIMMSSNSAWVVPAGADARRFFCLDVGDDHKQDTAYFEAIARQMGAGGREALLHDLLTRDLTNFNVRKVPITEMLQEQQSYSRRGVDALAYAVADSGELPCALRRFPNIALTSGESKGEGFIAEAYRLVPDLRRMGGATIKKELRKKYGCKHYESNGRTGIRFPPLNELRAMFTAQDHWGPNDVWATPQEEVSSYGYR